MFRRCIASTSRRQLSTRAHTLYSPTPELLERHLADAQRSTDSASSYLLSTSLSPSLLQPLLSSLQHALPNSIGSFMVSTPGTEPSLALATFDSGVTFRTGLSGRPKVEVGRYQRPGAVAQEGDTRGSVVGEIEDVRREEGWVGMWKGETGTTVIDELRGIEADSFLLLSDGLPRPVLQGLEAMFPQASKLGLLSAPTPFLTGRPHTFIHGNDIHSTGTIGIALRSRQITDVKFGLKPLTDDLTIATAQGNLLLTIEEGSGNPTQTLMTAIQKRDAGSLSNKDEEFFLRIGDRMIKILSGDPSRGALSLDMEDPLRVGQTVQLMQRDGAGLAKAEADTITFASLRRSDELDHTSPTGRPRVVEGFFGAGEDGFIHGSAICTVPNASAAWHVASRA